LKKCPASLIRLQYLKQERIVINSVFIFWHEAMRRYGFHGLSYEYIIATLGEAARGRMIVAHLGNEASMAALIDGWRQDITMGLSAMGGLMMGTRSSNLDPGVLLYLMYEKGYDAPHCKRRSIKKE
jgi:acetate kinase